MGQIQEDIMVATEDASAMVAMAGLSAKSVSQRRNFIARDGDINHWSGSEENESNWLTVANANRAVTQLNPEGEMGSKIYNQDRKILIDTPKQKGLEASIFVTAKGNVFCWPPYIFEGRAYVGTTNIAKDEKGNDFDTIEKALNTKITPIITFANGEIVKIDNASSSAKNFSTDTSVKYIGEAGDNPKDITASVFYKDSATAKVKGIEY